jgi:hypothetical protein
MLMNRYKILSANQLNLSRKIIFPSPRSNSDPVLRVDTVHLSLIVDLSQRLVKMHKRY